MADRVHLPADPNDAARRHFVTLSVPAQTLDEAATTAMGLAATYFAPTRIPRLVSSTARPIATTANGVVVLDHEGRVANRWVIECSFEGVLRPPERT